MTSTGNPALVMTRAGFFVTSKTLVTIFARTTHGIARTPHGIARPRSIRTRHAALARTRLIAH
jgi:hypothetical protein